MSNLILNLPLPLSRAAISNVEVRSLIMFVGLVKSHFSFSCGVPRSCDIYDERFVFGQGDVCSAFTFEWMLHLYQLLRFEISRIIF